MVGLGMATRCTWGWHLNAAGSVRHTTHHITPHLLCTVAQYATLRHTTPHNTTSHHTAQHHTTPHHTALHYTLAHRVHSIPKQAVKACLVRVRRVFGKRFNRRVIRSIHPCKAADGCTSQHYQIKAIHPPIYRVVFTPPKTM